MLINWELIRPSFASSGWLILSGFCLGLTPPSPKDAGPGKLVSFNSVPLGGWLMSLGPAREIVLLGWWGKFPYLSQFRMGVPSKIACSVKRVTLPNRVLLHRGLRHCDVLIRRLFLSSPGQPMAEGPAQIQQSTDSHAGTQLPAQYPPTHAVCSDGESMRRSIVPPGNPRTVKSQRQPGATFFTQFLPLEISPLPVVFFFNLINLFLAVLGFHCCPRAFSRCRGGWTYCRGQALGQVGSVVVAHGLNSSEA